MSETAGEGLTTTSRKRPGSGAKLFFVLIILALVAVIVYLLSLINSKKFFLAPENNSLVVKKGVLFLTGSERFNGNSPEEARLYAPIDLPSNFGQEVMEFSDLSSLNSRLATILIEQAQELVFSSENNKYVKGKAYLSRLGSLQGLDSTQLKMIQGLVADVDYIEAKRAYLEIENTLGQALKKFKQAETFGTGRFPDAPSWIDKVEQLLDAIRNTKAGITLVPAAEPADELLNRKKPTEARPKVQVVPGPAVDPKFRISGQEG
jgi:hypothetical protein